MFFGICTIASMIAFYTLFFGPFVEYLNAKSWVATSCVVTSSRIINEPTSKKSDVNIYKAVIDYEYEYRLNTYRGNKFHFIDFPWSFSDPQKRVDQYPPGKIFNCYVDPGNPNVAVIDRSLDVYPLFGAILFVFILMGIGGIYHVQKRSYFKENVKDTLVLLPEDRITIFVAVFFSCMIADLFFMIFFFGGWLVAYHQKHSWFMFETFTYLPLFALMIGSMYFVVYAFMQIFNPSVTLTLNPVKLITGNKYLISFVINGAVTRLSDFSIDLVGVKKVTTYNEEEKRSHTQDIIFYKDNIYHVEQYNVTTIGFIEYIFDDSLAPSRKEGNTEILWQIHAKGKIKFWPDMLNEYSIVLGARNNIVRNAGESESNINF